MVIIIIFIGIVGFIIVIKSVVYFTRHGSMKKNSSIKATKTYIQILKTNLTRQYNEGPNAPMWDIPGRCTTLIKGC